nr:hypothetical protein [Chlorobium phaeovibrioides]
MKQLKIHSPKYWNVWGKSEETGLNANASSGIESLYIIELAISNP